MLRLRWSAAVIALAIAYAQEQGTSLRSLAPMPPAASPLPALADGDPACDFLALRAVLDELQSRAQYLRWEANLAQQDAARLWTGWRGAFGSQVFGPYEQRIQVKTFSLYSDAKRAVESAAALGSKLELEDARWRTLSRQLEGPDSQGDAWASRELAPLRAAAGKLADHVNALDVDLRAAQRRLDRLFPEVTTLIERESPGAAPLAEPWHWSYYVARGQTRPALRYDFELEFQRAQVRARRDLDARAAGRAKSLRAR